MLPRFPSTNSKTFNVAFLFSTVVHKTFILVFALPRFCSLYASYIPHAIHTFSPRFERTKSGVASIHRDVPWPSVLLICLPYFHLSRLRAVCMLSCRWKYLSYPVPHGRSPCSVHSSVPRPLSTHATSVRQISCFVNV